MVPAPAHLQPNSLIAGKYLVQRVLGVGGMGTVVAAEHMILKQRVALKFLLDIADAHQQERFFREARAAARIESEHICRVMDVGALDDGTPFIVMELLSGVDLAGHLAAHGPMPPAEAADLVLQAIDALVEAHARGIVHRDLKPSNLFMARRADGTTLVKVLDFGISKVDAGPDVVLTASTQRPGERTDGTINPSMTETGSLMGSPPYMSPEQLRSARDVDARSDIWALGVVLYELVTGVRPFRGASRLELFAAIAAGAYVPLAQVRPDVPHEFAAVVDRCLRVALAERFPTAADLAEALAPWASDGARRLTRVRRLVGPGRASSPSWPGAMPSSPALSGGLNDGTRTTERGMVMRLANGTGRRRWAWPATIALGIAGVVLLGAGLAREFSGVRRSAAGDDLELPPAPSAALPPSAAAAGEPTLPTATAPSGGPAATLVPVGASSVGSSSSIDAGAKAKKRHADDDVDLGRY